MNKRFSFRMDALAGIDILREKQVTLMESADAKGSERTTKRIVIVKSVASIFFPGTFVLIVSSSYHYPS